MNLGVIFNVILGLYSLDARTLNTSNFNTEGYGFNVTNNTISSTEDTRTLSTIISRVNNEKMTKNWTESKSEIDQGEENSTSGAANFSVENHGLNAANDTISRIEHTKTLPIKNSNLNLMQLALDMESKTNAEAQYSEDFMERISNFSDKQRRYYIKNLTAYANKYRGLFYTNTERSMWLAVGITFISTFVLCFVTYTFGYTIISFLNCMKCLRRK